MENKTSRILIETVAKKTLRDLKNSPERSIRNAVDMALHFSEGRFQRHFFQAAQTMLQNEDSSYYGLIQDTVAHVNSQRLLTFGMNLGYNGCTMGAKKIREIEEEERFNIPWMISLRLSCEQYLNNRDLYHSIFASGADLGIYTWAFFVDGELEGLLSLAAEHADSAFLFFCKPETVTEKVLLEAETIKNLMFVVAYEKGVERACRLLRNSELPYAISFAYQEANALKILTGELFCTAELLHPIFTIMYAEAGTEKALQDRIYQRILEAREKQQFATIPWEFRCDAMYVDAVISKDACTASFDQEGYLYTIEGKQAGDCFNLYQNSLKEILKAAFPKKEATKEE